MNKQAIIQKINAVNNEKNKLFNNRKNKSASCNACSRKNKTGKLK